MRHQQETAGFWRGCPDHSNCPAGCQGVAYQQPTFSVMAAIGPKAARKHLHIMNDWASTCGMELQLQPPTPKERTRKDSETWRQKKSISYFLSQTSKGKVWDPECLRCGLVMDHIEKWVCVNSFAGFWGLRYWQARRRGIELYYQHLSILWSFLSHGIQLIWFKTKSWSFSPCRLDFFYIILSIY